MIRDIARQLLPTAARRGLRAAWTRAGNIYRHLRLLWRRPNIYATGSPERLGVIYIAPTHLSTAERMFLYSIVRGRRPARILEIGTNLGGSASILAAALEDNGEGRIIGLDPHRRVDPNAPRFYGRFKLIQTAAPEGLAEAWKIAGGPFDLVFYDGPNVYSEVKRILAAVLPLLAAQAQIVVDNGLHYGVHLAVKEICESDARVHDCGFVCTSLGVRDRYAAYNGLRLVRFDSNAVADPQPWIDLAYESAGVTPPSFDPMVLNHDGWWCREVRACEKCRSASADTHATS